MSYSLFNTVEVQIRDDGDLVSKFLQWQGDVGVYPMRGYTSCGCGQFFGIFAKSDEEELDKFFAEHG